MEDKDQIIASLCKQLSEANKKISALEQENALLLYQLDRIGEKELFDIPEYGTDEWANWMIEMNKEKRQ